MKYNEKTKPMTIRRDEALLEIARQIRSDEIKRTGSVPTLRRVAVLSVYHPAPSYYVEPLWLFKLWGRRNCADEKKLLASGSHLAARHRRLLGLMRKYIEEDGYDKDMAIRLVQMQEAPRFYISSEWAIKLLKGRI